MNYLTSSFIIELVNPSEILPALHKKDICMLVLLIPKNQAHTKSNSYFDGEFDAAIGLPPQSYSGDYWQGYLNKVTETGNTAF